MWKVFVIAGAILVVILTIRPYPAQVPVLGVEETGPPQSVNERVLNLDGVQYKVNWAVVDASKLVLVPNFTEKKIAREVYGELGCKLLINGGFYAAGASSAYSKPIGLFVANREEVSEASNNSLFNGFFSVNEFDTPRITLEVPRDPLAIALQTGPILQENNSVHVLKLVRDKAARRMVAAVTGKNELIFITIYKEEAVFSGPNLANLPAIISQFEEEEKLEIADAINLDGGAASAFFSSEVKLSEASPVGSFFCAK